MLSLSRLLAVAALAACVPLLPAEEKKPAEAKAEDSFKPLFNGKNLDGWVNVNCDPDTFFVKDGEIITTGKPTGFLRTEKQYENFVLEMDWMHVNKAEVGNSGLFVWGDPLPAVGDVYTRGIEVQVLVNLEYKDKKTGAVTATSHGDVFSIKGATCVPDRPHPLGWARCLPSENRAKGGGEWNHYKVTANDGVIKLEVNGKEVSGVSKCNPRKGYLALESEGAECHFKNIRIKELPSTNPKPEEIAKVAEGHVSLFKPSDLAKFKDGRVLQSKKYGPFEMIIDFRLNDKAEETRQYFFFSCCGGLSPNLSHKGASGMSNSDEKVGGWKDAKHTWTLKTPIKPGEWARSVVRFDGTTVSISTNGETLFQATTIKPRPDATINLWHGEGVAEIRNIFIRELKEEKK
jgi:hypothetical protein